MIRSSVVRLVLASTVLVLSVSILRAADDWPVFRGGDGQSKSPDTGLLKEWPDGGPALLWKAEDIGKGYSAVTVAGGLVYVTGDEDEKLYIRAFDLSGKEVWKKDNGPAWKASHPGSRASVTIDSGKAYLLSGVGVLGCYEAKTGRRLWYKEMKEWGGRPGGWGYAESPLVVGNAVIVKPGGKNCIVALNKMTGQQLWASQSFGGPEYSSCTYFEHNKIPLLVTGTRSGIICVSAKTGQTVWTDGFCAGNTANCPTPIYSDGYVFWSNGYGKGGICYKLDAQGKGQEVWRTRDLVSHHGGYLVQEGCIYGNHERGVTCLDLKTGQKKWTHDAVGKGSIAWADGMLYLFSERAGQAALATCSPDGLEIKGKVKVEGGGPSWAHPVIIGGRLYLRYDTTLYCFDIKAK